jgi:peptide/nickel transport system permease protein
MTMNNFKKNLQEIARYPTAIVGAVVILVLIGVAIYTMITIPYQKAIVLWRGGEDVWYQNPKTVPPEWFNLFTSKKEPISFVINAQKGNLTRTVKTHSDGSSTITLTYTFDYKYDDFPQDIALYFDTKFLKKQPFASLVWLTPDGRKINMANFALPNQYTYRFSQDSVLQTKLKGVDPMIALFADPKSANPKNPVPIKGTYQLVITGIAWEKNSDITSEFVFQGRVSGLAGTDFYRRDLMVALLWGVPVALAFGLIASVGTTVLTMVIAAIGAWYGRWVDGLIQRVTEVNLVLPFLPILIMIGTLFSRSIWVILGATVALSIFTGQIKAYRAIFMQVKETTYIEAAKAYGASNWRIITLYLIPRMIPTLIPSLVLSVPSFVFLEASLAVLGLGDPTLPTWGKIIDDAFNYGALYKGLYYWILEPAVLLMITGLAFALLGFALDRIFNPRLREA